MCGLLAGCVGHIGPQQRLAAAVYELNEAGRWGLSRSVIDSVEPGYVSRFLEKRRDWGELIRLAEADILQLRRERTGNEAVALVRYRWYRVRSMALYDTVVQQRWRSAGGGYGLYAEEVMDGDPDLFAEALDDQQRSAIRPREH